MAYSLLSFFLLFWTVTAAPVAKPEPSLPSLGDLLSTLSLPSNGVSPSTVSQYMQDIESSVSDPTLQASATAALLGAIQPTHTPSSIPDATALAAAAKSTSSGNILDTATQLIANGFKPTDLLDDLLSGTIFGINSANNINLIPPAVTIYPKKSASDAPYSLSESQLRAAIYIPSGFSYGRGNKEPVILSPGTATYGGVNFANNFAKLFEGSTFADPVWLNIPGALLGDAQVNAEYVAYAINYISSISQKKKVAVLTWSQGSLDTQWALKYWPSTQAVVSDFIAISPDLHGTTEAYFVCPNFPKIPCDPSVAQQAYDSNFVTTLRSNGGDSAYVPTTAVYSTYDEIVSPQADPNASGHFNDARGVGVSNNELQSICPGQAAGGDFSHEGVLYNALAYALAVDALTHDGPGQTSRIDLSTVCQEALAPGLDLQDVVDTEALTVLAVINILLYVPKMAVGEPAIASYAS